MSPPLPGLLGWGALCFLFSSISLKLLNAGHNPNIKKINELMQRSSPGPGAPSGSRSAWLWPVESMTPMGLSWDRERRPRGHTLPRAAADPLKEGGPFCGAEAPAGGWG